MANCKPLCNQVRRFDKARRRELASMLMFVFTSGVFTFTCMRMYMKMRFFVIVFMQVVVDAIFISTPEHIDTE